MWSLAGQPLPGDDYSMEGKHKLVLGLCNSTVNGHAPVHLSPTITFLSLNSPGGTVVCGSGLRYFWTECEEET